MDEKLLDGLYNAALASMQNVAREMEKLKEQIAVLTNKYNRLVDETYRLQGSIDAYKALMGERSDESTGHDNLGGAGRDN